jgi:hypothetical protein
MFLFHYFYVDQVALGLIFARNSVVRYQYVIILSLRRVHSSITYAI